MALRALASRNGRTGERIAGEESSCLFRAPATSGGRLWMESTRAATRGPFKHVRMVFVFRDSSLRNLLAPGENPKLHLPASLPACLSVCLAPAHRVAPADSLAEARSRAFIGQCSAAGAKAPEAGWPDLWLCFVGGGDKAEQSLFGVVNFGANDSEWPW